MNNWRKMMCRMSCRQRVLGKWKQRRSLPLIMANLLYSHHIMNLQLQCCCIPSVYLRVLLFLADPRGSQRANAHLQQRIEYYQGWSCPWQFWDSGVSFRRSSLLLCLLYSSLSLSQVPLRLPGNREGKDSLFPSQQWCGELTLSNLPFPHSSAAGWRLLQESLYL